jgi:hypothetical protein
LIIFVGNTIYMKSKPLGFRKCKHCSVRFQKLQPLAFVCSPKCAIAYSKEMEKKKRAKNWRVEKAILADSIKTPNDWQKDLEGHINKIVRLIDKGSPCISCDNPSATQYHAGHFYSVGARRNLRFNLQNIWLQCSQCNDHKGGAPLAYEAGLLKLIGTTETNIIKHQIPQDFAVMKFSTDEIKAAIKIAKQIVKSIESGNLDKLLIHRLEARKVLNKAINLYIDEEH